MGSFGFCEYLWVPRGFGGFPWVSLGFHGSFRFFGVPKDILGQFGFIWVFVGICGFPMGLVGSPGFLLVFLGSLGFLEFQRTFWVNLGSFGFLWVSVGSPVATQGSKSWGSRGSKMPPKIGISGFYCIFM